MCQAFLPGGHILSDLFGKNSLYIVLKFSGDFGNDGIGLNGGGDMVNEDDEQ